MRMNALVIGDPVIQEGKFGYDQKTGDERMGYSVRISVLDRDTRSTYDCTFNSGLPGLDELRQLLRENGTQEEIDAAYQLLERQLPADMSILDIEVVKVRAKGGFLTMSCRLVQVLQAAAVA